MNPNQLKLTGAKILIVDDELTTVDMLRKTLESKSYRISLARSGEDGLNRVSRIQPDLILLDIRMPGIDGFETCRRLKADESSRNIPVVFITSANQTASVLEGFRVGGVDYITKPFEPEEALIRVETHLKNARLTEALRRQTEALNRKNSELQSEMERRERAENALKTAGEQLSVLSQEEAERWGIPGFVAQSGTMTRIMENIRQLHNYDNVSVLITGESGTGKEMIARALHFGGARKSRPFKVVNCGAIPAQLAESELFGHVKGAFTGADRDKAGAFELAAGGTLFLDEIGDMPFELQVKLLRVLQDGSFTPVGGTQEKYVDVRVLAATNANLQNRIQEEKFREDLYFRLNDFEIELPPLRERTEDIPLLTDHILNRFSEEMKIEKPKLSEDALTALMGYSFPGNVRELERIIIRAVILSDGSPIRPQHLPFTPSDASTPPVETANTPPWVDAVLSGKTSYNDVVTDFQRQLVLGVLKACDGNRHETARRLDMHRPNLIRLMKRLDIDEEA
jgi:DNA-binding NtrC family response regulator